MTCDHDLEHHLSQIKGPNETRFGNEAGFRVLRGARRRPMSNSPAPWVAWYKTARWRDLKRQVHLRDNFTCRRTGIVLVGKHPAPNSPVANLSLIHISEPTRPY